MNTVYINHKFNNGTRRMPMNLVKIAFANVLFDLHLDAENKGEKMLLRVTPADLHVVYAKHGGVHKIKLTNAYARAHAAICNNAHNVKFQFQKGCILFDGVDDFIKCNPTDTYKIIMSPRFDCYLRYFENIVAWNDRQSPITYTENINYFLIHGDGSAFKH